MEFLEGMRLYTHVHDTIFNQKSLGYVLTIFIVAKVLARISIFLFFQIGV